MAQEGSSEHEKKEREAPLKKRKSVTDAARLLGGDGSDDFLSMGVVGYSVGARTLCCGRVCVFFRHESGRSNSPKITCCVLVHRGMMIVTKGVFLCIVVTVDRLMFKLQIRVLWFLHFSAFFSTKIKAELFRVQKECQRVCVPLISKQMARLTCHA